jgi:hypothetical protein
MPGELLKPNRTSDVMANHRGRAAGAINRLLTVPA